MSEVGESAVQGRRSTVFKDPRVDRFVSWILTSLVAVLLAVGAFVFGDLRDEVKSVKTNVSNVTVTVEVLKTNQNASMTSMAASQATMTSISAAIQQLTTAVEILKGVGNSLNDLKEADRDFKRQIEKLEDRIRAIEAEEAKNRPR